MGGFLNIFGDIEAQTDEAKRADSVPTGNASEQSKTSGLNTNFLKPQELSVMNDDMITQMAAMASQAAPKDTTSTDYFPGAGSPVTEQGYSGQTFSAPTIAASGELFPFAAYDAHQRAKQAAQAKMLEPLQYKDLHVKNPLAEGDFQSGYMGFIGKKYADAKSKYGALAGTALNNDMEFQQKLKEYEYEAGQYNELYDEADSYLKNVGKDGKPIDNYRSDKGRGSAVRFMNNADNYFADPDNKDFAQKYHQSKQDLLTNITMTEVIKNDLGNLKSTMDANQEILVNNAKGLFGQPLGTSEEKVNALRQYSGGFLKPVIDKNGNITDFEIDRDAVTDHALRTYNNAFGINVIPKVDEKGKPVYDKDGNVVYQPLEGTEQERIDSTVDVNDFVKQFNDSFAKDTKTTLSQVSTGALGYARLAHQKEQDKKKEGIFVKEKEAKDSVAYTTQSGQKVEGYVKVKDKVKYGTQVPFDGTFKQTYNVKTGKFEPFATGAIKGHIVSSGKYFPQGFGDGKESGSGIDLVKVEYKDDNGNTQTIFGAQGEAQSVIDNILQSKGITIQGYDTTPDAEAPASVSGKQTPQKTSSSRYLKK